jgi:hypothetical protein
MIDFNQVLSNLSHRRSIFHSENDFQFELAWQLKLYNTQLEIRIEKPITPVYIDLFLIDGCRNIGIELKYKTSKIEHFDKNTGEMFNLKEHAALDLGRYDFLNDISRLEILKSKGLIDIGYCIFLTNCIYYWSPIRYNYKVAPNDINFRLEDGLKIKGQLFWTPETKESTVGKKRMEGLTFLNQHTMHWWDYSDLTVSNGKFRYLLIEIK